MSLSDKLRCNNGTNKEHIRDVKEFIKELKEAIVNHKKFPTEEILLEEIDKLAGDKLI